MRGGTRPTRDGLLALALTLALTAVALAASNNLLYLVVSGLWALLAASTVLGAWNLRGLSASRILPADLFAGVEASGRLVLKNERRILPAVSVEVEDAGATGLVGWAGCGGEGSAPVAWCFDRRGVARLGAVRLRSTFPFGFVEHVREIERPAEVVVYPHPVRSSARPRSSEATGEAAPGRLRGRGGDFAGLRSYRPGDRPSAVHWRSTARFGEVLVIEGSGEVEPQLDVVVHDRGDREGELARATGEILDGFDRGLRVGLVLPGFDGRPGQRLPPSGGLTWRRTLLELLARVPEGP